MTSCTNTLLPLSDDGPRYSVNDLATLNNLWVTELSSIDTTSIQELCQPLAQSVGLAQHLLVNPQLTAITMVVNHDRLRQQLDQEQTDRQIG
jgi:hypothetical protein